MPSELIKKHLQELKSQKKFDDGFIDALSDANEKNEARVSMDYEYKKSGKYNILVKVIDIFGNDTTKLIEVEI